MKFLRNINLPYWYRAFEHAVRVGIIEVGKYELAVDRDALLMYCMGQEL